LRTHTPPAPWVCARADHKKVLRLEVIRHLLHAIGRPAVARKVDKPDPKVLFPFDPEALTDGRLER
jgi:hypothetical protein